MMDLLKMRGFGMAAAFLSIALFAGTTMGAAQRSTQPEDRAGVSQEMKSSDMKMTHGTSFSVLKADDLIGMDVVDAGGDKVAELQDIVVSREDGKIAYGVIAHGGFLGIGQKLDAVSWKSLQMRGTEGDRQLVLNISRDQIENSEGFDKDNWPSSPTLMLSTASSERSLETGEMAFDIERDDDMSYGYVGDRPESREMARDTEVTTREDSDALVAQGRLLKVSELMGWNLRHGDRDIGEVKDFVIDMQNGHLAYAVASFDNTVDTLNDRSAVIPFAALTLNTIDEEYFALGPEVTTDALVAVSYEGDELPNLSDQTYAQNIHQQFNVEPYWEVFGYVGDEARDAGRSIESGVREGAEELKEGARELRDETREEIHLERSY